MKRTACMYNDDPNQIHVWKNPLSGLNEEENKHWLAILTSLKGQAKKTLHSGKVHINIDHYRAIRNKFDMLCSAR